MPRLLACFVMMSLVVAEAQELASQPELAKWSWMDQAFRDKADELASTASSFERDGKFVAASDLYREALEILTIDPKNGWRFNAYRKSYREVIANQDFLKPVILPGEQFDIEKWEGFNPALLESTILPKLEFAGKPLNDCLDWLESESARLNPNQSGLKIQNRSRQANVERSEVTLRLKDTPLRDALRYTASLQNLRIKWGDDHLFLEPISSHSSDLWTSLLKANPAILTGEFGSGEELRKEAGIVLRDYETIIINKDRDSLLVRASDEKMAEIVLWIRVIDRVEIPELANLYVTECLKLADYYSKLGETELSERRRRQASQTLTWLGRLHQG